MMEAGVTRAGRMIHCQLYLIIIAVTVGAGLCRHSTLKNRHRARLRTIENQGEDPPGIAGPGVKGARLVT